METPRNAPRTKTGHHKWTPTDTQSHAVTRVRHTHTRTVLAQARVARVTRPDCVSQAQTVLHLPNHRPCRCISARVSPCARWESPVCGDSRTHAHTHTLSPLSLTSHSLSLSHSISHTHSHCPGCGVRTVSNVHKKWTFHCTLDQDLWTFDHLHSPDCQTHRLAAHGPHPWGACGKDGVLVETITKAAPPSRPKDRGKKQQWRWWRQFQIIRAALENHLEPTLVEEAVWTCSAECCGSVAQRLMDISAQRIGLSGRGYSGTKSWSAENDDVSGAWRRSSAGNGEVCGRFRKPQRADSRQHGVK